MRFKVTRAWAAAGIFDGAEKEHSGESGQGGGAEGGKSPRAAPEKNGEAQGIPEPSIAETRGNNHPPANPARSAPAMHAMHQTMVAGFDVEPHSARYGHAGSPSAEAGAGHAAGLT